MGYVIGAVVMLIVVLGLPLATLIVQGYVLTKLWSWFVVPLFHLPPLTWAWAIGLLLVFGHLRPNLSTKDKDKDEDKGQGGDDRFTSKEEASKGLLKAVVTMLTVAATPLLSLLLGWIVHTYFL